MKTAGKVFLFLTLLLAHKALVAQENPDVNLNKLVQMVNTSVAGWLTPSPRS